MDPRLCIMLARSALITRWNSNQVPWDPWLCIESRPAAPTMPGPHGSIEGTRGNL
jgi:hypothetical protein